MKELLKILDIQKKKKQAIPKPKAYFHSSSTYLCYKINGYWFRLNQLQWAHIRDITPSVIAHRIKSGHDNAHILGFKKIKRGTPVRKNNE